jgi:hypothetical protein
MGPNESSEIMRAEWTVTFGSPEPFVISDEMLKAGANNFGSREAFADALLEQRAEPVHGELINHAATGV